MPAEFAFYVLVKDWVPTVAGVLRAEPHLRAIGRPKAAELLERAFVQLKTELDALGKEMAVVGTLELRKMEKATRVRPDHIGPASDKSLGDALFARTLTPHLTPGAIGIADEATLDKDVPWWITNEIGSSARVGGAIYGTFYGVASAGPPDMDHFREHPLFEAGNASGLAGLGIIQNPIPARRFIKKSIPVIESQFKARFEPIGLRFRERLAAIAKVQY
jgi:hypothetical protein